MSGNAATIDVATDAPPVTTSNTSDGFIVGVEPAKSPDQLRLAQQQAARDSGTLNAPPPQTTGERLFTATEVEGFRQQEKEKLYGSIEDMQRTVQTLQAEREAERAAQEQAVREAEEAAKAKAEDEMDVRDLLYKTREEMESQIRAARDDAERANALLEKERQLQELNAYRAQRIADASSRIVPEIIDFIGGDSPEQIDASVADAIVRSERIVQGALAVQQQQLQGMQGTRTTAPSGNGPLEEQQEMRQMSPEDIRNMSPSEFAAMRGKLLQAGSQQFYGRR